MFLLSLQEPGGVFIALVSVPFSPVCRRIMRVSAGYPLPVTWGGTDMWASGNTFLFREIIHPIFFWPLKAKRLGINFSYLSLFFIFLPLILPLLTHFCHSWSTCYSDDSLTLPQKTEKLKIKQANKSRIWTTTCPMFCIIVIGNETLKINYLWVEERFPLLSNISVPDQTVWTTKPHWPSKFLVDHHLPKASILNKKH